MIKAILTSIGIFILGLVGVEIVLRIMNSDMSNYDIEMWNYARELKMQDPVLGHVHKPNAAATLQSVQIKLNSMGMRSEEINPQKEKVVFLGSSFTLGWGVKFSEAYPTLIDEYMKESGSGFQVLNSSTGNYNSYNYVNNFLLHQSNLKPKYIVINYFLNDAEVLPKVSDNIILKNSQLAATLLLTVRKLLSAKDAGLVDYYNSLYEPDSEGFKRMKDSLKSISNYARTNNAHVFLVMIPEMHFLKEKYPFMNIHTRMREISEELGFKYHDLLPVLDGIDAKDIQVMEGDSHPNAYVHSLVAGDLINSLFRKLD